MDMNMTSTSSRFHSQMIVDASGSDGSDANSKLHVCDYMPWSYQTQTLPAAYKYPYLYPYADTATIVDIPNKATIVDIPTQAAIVDSPISNKNANANANPNSKSSAIVLPEDSVFVAAMSVAPASEGSSSIPATYSVQEKQGVVVEDMADPTFF